MFSFGVSIVVSCNKYDEVNVISVNSRPVEEVVYTIANIDDISSIQFDFLTIEHRKEFLKDTVFALIDECVLQKIAFNKIIEKHGIYDNYIEYFIDKRDNIEFLEKELVLFLAAWS